MTRIIATITFCYITSLTANLFAWEDPILEPGSTTPPPAVTSSRKATTDLYSQYLDETLPPLYSLGLAYFGDAEIEDFSEISQTELDATLRLGYYKNILGGDIDLGLYLHTIFFSGAGGIGLPSSVIELAPDLGWTWRFVNNLSLSVRTLPGIYGDTSGAGSRMLSYPSSLTFFYSPDHNLSLKLGALVRPGWNAYVLPEFGMVWAPSDTWRFDFAFPESEITWYAMRGFSTHINVAWDSRTYALKATSDQPDSLTIEEIRLFGGAKYQISTEISLRGDIGLALNREYENDGSSIEAENETYTVDDTLFFRLALVGPF